MQSMGQRRLGILSLTLLGTLLGALAGFWVGRAMLLRAARISLSDYAFELIEHGDHMGEELNGIFRHSSLSPLPFCSDREIAAMQAATFNSQDFKDVGRTRDGKLFCSAFLGRLPHPYSEGAPTLVLESGTNIYINVPVILGAFDQNHATVIEEKGMDAVLNPAAFDRWEHPHVRYMIAAVNRRKGQIAPVAGSLLDRDPAWVLSRGTKTVSGTIYRSRCSYKSPVCAVTAESIADIWAGSRAMQIVYSIMGAIAGFSFGLALSLFYRETTNQTSQLHRDLRRSAPSLRLVYQPIVDIKTRRCEGAEALIRWTDHGGAPVSPDVFVHLAEENGFIGELTAFVVRQATRELGDHLRRNPTWTLSLNIAAADLAGPSLIPLLEKYIVSAGIHPGQIALELTERSTAELGVVRSSIHRLCAQGYKVHIDDFGTGFSSLSYLDQLAVSAIKIDRAFTRTIGTDAVTAPILPQMLSMAESLAVEVIVEGVETEQQNDYLEATGKRLQVQGWYFSKPMNAESLIAFHQDTARLFSSARSNASASGKALTETASNEPIPEEAFPDEATPDQTVTLSSR